MTAEDIINTIEKTYIASDLIYEMMFAHFVNLSGFGFHTVSIKKGSPIVRARYSNHLNSFKKLSDISYPQKEHVKYFSRLNRPGQNLFYASESENACLAEMLPFWFDEFKKGDIIQVTLGKWIVMNDMKLLIIPDTENLNELNRKVISQLQPPEKEFWNYISKKFKTSTKEDRKIYEFTSAFGNALWLNTKIQDFNVNGFLYGSVQKKEDVNIAFSTETIDSGNLAPIEFAQVHFQMNGYNSFRLPIYSEIGDRKHGQINLDKVQINWD